MRLLLVLLCACASQPRPMQLRRVILYQNGIGYFERTGHLQGPKLSLTFAVPELDDVLKTLTVIDRMGGSVATVDVPTVSDKQRTMSIGVRLGVVRDHDLLVGYAVPTPTWKAAYRIVLDDKPNSTLLQGWAMVNNASQEDWEQVALTLATGAPMSYANDFSRPQYVSRPDATGRLIAPTVLGPIDGTTAGAGDRDADGIADSVDKCPDDPTDDDYEDGCPDVRHAIVSDTEVVVLQPIVFARGSAELPVDANAILDMTATTMKEHPDLAKLEIGGHASADEVDPWSLSSSRATAVRDALIARGVAADRLSIAPYAATQSIDKSNEKNRRIEFLILKRVEDPEPITTQAVQASARPKTKPSTVAGAVRYVLSEPVSIKKGASTMVSILNKPVSGEDVYLFKPDPKGPGSDRHPFRAVKLVNTSGFMLEPGPVAIFGRGSFVGDTLLDRLAVDETAWIPYALDGSTTVTVERAASERPSRMVSIAKGVITVENTSTQITRYTIKPGRETAHKMYVRHPKLAGYAARELPPGTIDQGDAYLIPLPLTPAKQSTLAIEERQPIRRAIALTDARVGVYITEAPPEIAHQLQTAITLRGDLAKSEEELTALRVRIGDLAERANEIRESIKAIEKVKADELRKKLVASLVQTTAQSEELGKSLGAKTEAMWAAKQRLADAVRDLSLAEK